MTSLLVQRLHSRKDFHMYDIDVFCRRNHNTLIAQNTIYTGTIQPHEVGIESARTQSQSAQSRYGKLGWARTLNHWAATPRQTVSKWNFTQHTGYWAGDQLNIIIELAEGFKHCPER